ncbi:locomotion-related protein Hikaru genki [Eurytemora carolleeae]|uniref:locomotion-related protein Hikaru genki n=1 Tax=Eurytemora carolleeae TaxID=1294199 RepID=UPI000C789A86|nr:locomotion-related protein Hikaru genki [Eurytemora carolleeae]|eukprot:XP_023331988.1 locomotion-related protein Hikaru genki-like [Eurytemora affinis]
MLKGKPVAFCSNNGEWSNSSPYCVKACTYPGAAIRGSMDSVKFYYSIGEEVNFKCSANLTMKGEPRIKCLNSGTWSSEIPVCLE